MVWVPSGAQGEVTDLGEITLERWGGLFGRAVLADGTPAEGEVLRLFQLHRVLVSEAQPLGAWRPDSWFGSTVARTREDGFFRFETLAPGAYEFVPGPTGSFRFENLTEGPHRLVATDPRFETASAYPCLPGQSVLLELGGR
jgi:hypothetical protein